MRLTSVTNVYEFDQHDIDLLIVALGFEARATAVSTKCARRAKRRVAWQFVDRHTLSFEANTAWFKRDGFEIVDIGDDDARDWFLHLFEEVTERHSGSSANVVIDISCFTRARLAVLMSAVKRANASGSLIVRFVYNLARYSQPPQGAVPNQFSGPVHPDFAGWFDEPDLPLSAVVGLGYEEDKAVGAVEHLQASDIWAFIPQSSISEYEPHVLRANGSLLDLVIPERRLSYNLHDPARAFVMLDGLCNGLSRNHNVVLIPLGPKMFALICLLRGLLEPRTPVWRVSAGDLEPAFQRVPSELFVVLAATFLPNLAGGPMVIEFPGPAIPADDGGIAFRAMVDGKVVSCRFTMEALQDVDPRLTMAPPLQQFESSRSRLLSIARAKIEAGQVQNEVVWVSTGDL